MIFESLHESARRGELMLIDGGYCRFHLRKDGTITIYEIISTRQGAGSAMLSELKTRGAIAIVAKCPTDLAANGWYHRRGFVLIGSEMTETGRLLNVWKLSC